MPVTRMGVRRAEDAREGDETFGRTLKLGSVVAVHTCDTNLNGSSPKAGEAT
jgi:hypothetical protein